MASNKRLIAAGAAAGGAGAFDPLQNFETVTYTGNGGTQKITGYIRKGAAFNGSSSIDLGSNLGLANNSFSFSFWLNANSQSSDHYFIGDTGTWGSNNLHIGVLDGSTNKLRISFGSGGTLDSATSVSHGTWQHWVTTYNATTNSLIIYLNGSLDNSFTTSIDYTNTTNIQLGDIALSGYNGNGKLDQVRIFDKALSSSEVGQLAGETYASSTKSTTDYFGDGHGVALYELDDSANDTGGVSGKFGEGAIISGTTSRIEVPYASKPSLSTATVSFWLKTTSTNTQSLIGEGYSSNRWGNLQIYIASNKLNARSGNASTAEDLPWLSTSDVNTGNWVHCVVTITGNTSQIFINGTLETTKTLTVTRAATTNPFTIGQLYANGSIFTSWTNDVKIDQVRIFNKVLSSSEVTTLYNETSATASTFDIFSDSSAVALYELDGDATDETGTYDGTATNVSWGYDGTATNVNFLGMAFQPDLVWVKTRSISSGHVLRSISMDSTYTLSSNSTAVLNTAQPTGGRLQLDSNGFTVRDISNNGYGVNGSGYTQVAWCWRAAGAANTYNVLEGGTVTSDSTASGAGITAGTITTGWEVSANRDAGFSIVKYTKSGTSGTMGHGLSSAPEIIFEKRTDGAAYWNVRVNGITANNQTIYLNESTGVSTHPSLNLWTTPTASVFGYDSANATAGDYIAYCFHSVDGYQKVGSYTGTGVSGNSETTGFRPRFLMVKAAIRPSGGGSWYIFDSVRTTSNPQGQYLQANEPLQEFDGTSVFNIDFENNGFTVNGTNNEVNQSGSTYIYLAIA